MNYLLTNDQIKHYRKNGYLVSRNFFTKKDIKNLITWINEIENFKEVKGKWMKYYDRSIKNKNQNILTRIENFYDYHKKLKKFFSDKKILDQLKKINGSKLVLFKDKINFKYPGAKGFKAHQDATIWDGMYGIKTFISVVISIDHSSKKNGRLEISNYNSKQKLLSQSWKKMTKSMEKKIKWHPVDTKPGDLIIFNDYTPHKSADNLSNSRRRMLFLTYNKKSEGNHRRKHFKDKRNNFPPNFERKKGKQYVFHI
jgi:ectoine hydroxylase-related dioxygenase (phytanoyl-CoA dioxygenase family)